ncbi:MAG: RsmB/NOP family class I SAM-dependent RNA methyltransferase [Clostridia bacterium]|nr:RsmB/NOP family class I SAM-dependent RNA methyltransferase [Clostridia bacterium]
MENLAWLRARLFSAHGTEISDKIWRGYEAARPVTLRVNLLKSDIQNVTESLSGLGISFRSVDWYDSALIIENAREPELMQTALFQKGEIYLQSLSSMLPPLYMEPYADENILDMTAAPGGKTTQMSALSGGRAFITACERDSVRAERLRYNVEKQGASRVTVLTTDSAKLDDFFKFDKILLDAPCSGSGTIYLTRPAKISEKLIKNSSVLQKKLLAKALKLLKKGGTLVYSTCSVLPCENEEILEPFLKSGEAEFLPIQPFSDLPIIPSKTGTICVCPDELFEGFFVAKIKKL